MTGKWEYGQLYSGGGFLTFNESPAVEAVYPLADRLEAGMRHGGHVYRRRIIVLDDWEEITEVPDVSRSVPADKGGRQQSGGGRAARGPGRSGSRAGTGTGDMGRARPAPGWGRAGGNAGRHPKDHGPGDPK